MMHLRIYFSMCKKKFLRLSWILIAISLVVMADSALSQQPPPPDAPQPQNQPQQTTQAGPSSPEHNSEHNKVSKNHIFWVIPNYRADESQEEFKPLTRGAKVKVALDDSFDPSAFLVAGVFAGISMAQKQYPHFGQGAEGFGKYYGGAFADQGIGNFMTEALFPIALRQDPRYFTKERGGFWKRTGYAISREVVTRGDNGHSQFNTSELAGNAVAAGISNLYYPAQDRSFGNTASKWGQQIGLDTLFNVMKEFWPDTRRKLFGR
jgi:hypothetical protein